MIVKVVFYSDFESAPITQVKTELIYDNVRLTEVELVSDNDRNIVTKSLVFWNEDGRNVIDLFQSTVYLMNDSGKTIETYHRIPREWEMPKPLIVENQSGAINIGVDGIRLGATTTAQ